MIAGDGKHPAESADEVTESRQVRDGETAADAVSPVTPRTGDDTPPVEEPSLASRGDTSGVSPDGNGPSDAPEPAEQPSATDDARGTTGDADVEPTVSSGHDAEPDTDSGEKEQTATGHAPADEAADAHASTPTEAHIETPPDAHEGSTEGATEGASTGIASDVPARMPDGGDQDGGAPPSSEGAETPADAPPPAKRTLADALAETAAEEEEEEEEEARGMTLLDHLNELRIRLVRCLIAVAISFAACYSFAERLFELLMVPLVKAMPPDSKLIFTALPEAFFVYMQVGLVAATFVASPYIFFQIWSFISPGLYEEEKKNAIPVALFSASFFIGGAAFCYYQVFPYAFEFFMGFATDRILPMPSLSEYLGFSLKMLLAFGLIFEMPLFTYFLARFGILTAGMMRRGRKYAILGIFIVAAILTPPDVFSQMLMACPMLVLYELSIFIAAAVGRKDKTETEDEEDATEGETDGRPEQGH